MSKATERASGMHVDTAYEHAYNKKNRRFTFGGITVVIPIPADEKDIKALCKSLMKGGDKVELIPSLANLRKELLSNIRKSTQQEESVI